ncbi:unnamed protein product [Peniophora sp. CBMAI 1063]|nr:unnamed protein product [Peniophora sp. CBMAI 1063]
MPTLLYIEESCTVCAEDFCVDRKIHNLKCGHVFCRPCLSNLNPSLCPVCRKSFRQNEIECVGPWESDPSPVQTDDKWDDWRDVLDRIALMGIEDDTWVPSTADREQDYGVREELGLPRDRGEEDWNRDAWLSPSGHPFASVSLDSPSSIEWAPGVTLSDREYAEDSAAWAAIALRPRAGGSSSAGGSQRMSIGRDEKGGSCVIC